MKSVKLYTEKFEFKSLFEPKPSMLHDFGIYHIPFTIYLLPNWIKGFVLCLGLNSGIIWENYHESSLCSHWACLGKPRSVNNILGMSNSWNLFLIREHKMGQKNLPCLQHKGLWLCTLWRPVIQHCQTSWTSSSDWNFSFSSPLSGHCDPSWIEKSHCHGWWFLIKYFLLNLIANIRQHTLIYNLHDVWQKKRKSICIDPISCQGLHNW